MLSPPRQEPFPGYALDRFNSALSRLETEPNLLKFCHARMAQALESASQEEIRQCLASALSKNSTESAQPFGALDLPKNPLIARARALADLAPLWRGLDGASREKTCVELLRAMSKSKTMLAVESASEMWAKAACGLLDDGALLPADTEASLARLDSSWGWRNVPRKSMDAHAASILLETARQEARNKRWSTVRDTFLERASQAAEQAGLGAAELTKAGREAELDDASWLCQAGYGGSAVGLALARSGLNNPCSLLPGLAVAAGKTLMDAGEGRRQGLGRPAGTRFGAWRSWKPLLSRPEWNDADRNIAADRLARIAISANAPEAYAACRPRGPLDGIEQTDATRMFGEKAWMSMEKTWISRTAPTAHCREAKPAKRL